MFVLNFKMILSHLLEVKCSYGKYRYRANFSNSMHGLHIWTGTYLNRPYLEPRIGSSDFRAHGLLKAPKTFNL